MFWFLLLVNIFYLTLELVFNVSLLNIASSSQSYEDIHHIELFGRFLSSFGFTFIFWKIISTNKKLNTHGKLLSIFLISLFVYPVAFYGQYFLINKLSNNVTDQTKKSSYALVLLQDGLKTGVINLGLKSYTKDTLNTPENKTFSVLNSILILQNPTALNYINSNLEAISYKIFSEKSRSISSQKYEQINALIDLESEKFWNEYLSSKQRIEQEQKNSSYKIIQKYDQINANVKLSWRDYHRWQERYSRTLQDFYEKNLEGDLMSITRCKNLSCYQQIKEHNASIVSSGYANQQKIRSSTFRMDQDIVMSRRFSKPEIYAIEKVCQMTNTGKAIYQLKEQNHISVHSFALKTDFIGGIQCFINRDEMKKDFFISNETNIFRNLHTSNINHNSINSYLNDKEIQQFLDKEARMKIGFVLPKPFPVDNIQKFKQDLTSEKLVYDFINTELNNKYGILFSKPLQNKKDLLLEPSFLKLIKAKNSDFELNDIEVIRSKKRFNDEYMTSYVKKANESFLLNYNNSTKFSLDGHKQVKAVIIPPIALFLSLFFSMINLVILIASIYTKLVKNITIKRKIHMFMIFLIISFISCPFLIDNTMTKEIKYTTLINQLKNQNVLLGFVIDWTMRTEPIILGAFNNTKWTS